MKKSIWEIVGHDEEHYTKKGRENILELANMLELLSYDVSKEQLELFRELLSSGHLHEALDILGHIIENGTDFTV